MPRESAEVVAAACRIVRAVGRRLEHEDLDGFRLLAELELELEAARARLVHGLRAVGYSDGQIGAELGITRQAVQQKWPRVAA